VFVLTPEGASKIVEECKLHGVDLMIDYDHASLNPFSVDPAMSGRAAGWFQAEARADGLWATNVRWTEAAGGAIRAKEWRYVSPAFAADEAGTITSLLNVAITNMPATRRAIPLVAASKRARKKLSQHEGCMTPEQLQAIIDLLDAGDVEGAKAALTVMAAGNTPAEAEAPSESAPAAPEVASEAPAAPSEEDKQMVAAARVACSVLEVRLDASDFLAEVKRLHGVAKDLEAREAKVAEAKAVLEAGERKRLVAELVKLGAEVPATAWADDTATVPCKRLQAEPIEEMRARVQTLSASKGKASPAKPPASPDADASGRIVQTSRGAVTLSAREIAICNEYGTSLADYAESKAKSKK
jgi:phage I-like protein